MIRACNDLDAYLAGDLSATAAGRFEAHLDECATCRGAVGQQRWIDGLLRSSTSFESDIPQALFERAAVRVIARRRRHATLAACSLAAAASIVVVALNWTAWLNQPAEGPTIVGVADAAAMPLVTPAAAPSVAPADDISTVASPRATFVGGPDVIVVPVESPHPSVTIVRVYPAYRPGDWVRADSKQPAAVDKFTSPESFQGG